jgi:hypothetical protein
MLRTNLSTRPFYNARAVNMALGLLALVVLAVTAFNVVQATRLTLAQRTLGAHAAESEAEAARLRTQAATIRARIDPKELSVVSAAAREANAIIDRRAFSWTELFSQVEAVLPEDVRITAMKPEVGADGSYAVSIQVEGRRVEDVDAFVEALEARSTFRNVLPVAEQTSDEGLIEGVIEGIYIPATREAAAASPTSAGPAPVEAEVTAQRSRND